MNFYVVAVVISFSRTCARLFLLLFGSASSLEKTIFWDTITITILFRTLLPSMRCRTAHVASCSELPSVCLAIVITGQAVVTRVAMHPARLATLATKVAVDPSSAVDRGARSAQVAMPKTISSFNTINCNRSPSKQGCICRQAW